MHVDSVKAFFLSILRNFPLSAGSESMSESVLPEDAFSWDSQLPCLSSRLPCLSEASTAMQEQRLYEGVMSEI